MPQLPVDSETYPHVTEESSLVKGVNWTLWLCLALSHQTTEFVGLSQREEALEQ